MNPKKLNTIALVIYLISMILGLVLSIISITDPRMFTAGFVFFVVSLFMFFIAMESREKMKWK